ncbi:undecaprenyl/decaprenyl-phosphate alpha-N-acetylglucosaminyl 1-phosphate transferase [Dyella silvatica]|uniref:undecaprenyl/decaprenyl-phosphate alpha-N-acetylglucosaminyl 1-phosphate transferase n=1 Tax=Dyella silvatica TaxID=2992128 RepID=UPI002253C659|nr:undecaprenyl/decaprenyl-phosphate alpha-N-acetylglucosaminyl 1-phosphate transferase [Dyella silvatica]
MLRKCADALGLIDKPNERKLHIGSVPLIGGLAIFMAVLNGTVYYGDLGEFTQKLLGTATVLAILGALDDRDDLSVRSRLFVQTVAILTMIASTGIYVHRLGHVFGTEVDLGWAGIPVTVIAVIGLLNAFNMMDGIDGLAGGLSLMSIGSIFLFNNQIGLQGVTVLVLLLAVAMLPFMLTNLGLLGRKIFMGDAGSMVLGYLLAWTLIQLSQGAQPTMSSSDVLWCVALPVFDTLAVMYRRMREGASPFRPDRGHIHHMLMRAGLGPRRTLLALLMLAGGFTFIGNLTHKLGPGVNFIVFGGLSIIYTVTMARVWNMQTKTSHEPITLRSTT